jgi:hypothetical protein
MLNQFFSSPAGTYLIWLWEGDLLNPQSQDSDELRPGDIIAIVIGAVIIAGAFPR